MLASLRGAANFVIYKYIHYNITYYLDKNKKSYAKKKYIKVNKSTPSLCPDGAKLLLILSDLLLN